MTRQEAQESRWARQTPGPSLPGERWKAIPDHPGYEASNHGRIRSAHTILTIGYPAGKPTVTLSFAGQIQKAGAGRLVALAWHGLPPNADDWAVFKDGDQTNLRPSNVVWMSRDQWQAWQRQRGPRGNTKIKLTSTQREQLRKDLETEARPADLARKYGVSPGYISNLRAGRNILA